MRSLALILPLALASTSFAQLTDEDVGAVVTNNRLVTWAADDVTETYVRPERVFHGAMDLISGAVVGDEPGWLFLPGSELAGHTVGFNLRAALRAWDPQGASTAPNANFQTIPSSSLTFGNVILGTVTTPSLDPASPITGLQITVPAAGLDFHYPLTLNAPALEGIYLVELELRTNLSGVTNSLPYFAVLNYGLAETEHERAVLYVQQYVVPTPGTATAILSLVVFAARRRR